MVVAKEVKTLLQRDQVWIRRQDWVLWMHQTSKNRKKITMLIVFHKIITRLDLLLKMYKLRKMIYNSVDLNQMKALLSLSQMSILTACLVWDRSPSLSNKTKTILNGSGPTTASIKNPFLPGVDANVFHCLWIIKIPHRLEPVWKQKVPHKGPWKQITFRIAFLSKFRMRCLSSSQSKKVCQSYKMLQ